MAIIAAGEPFLRKMVFAKFSTRGAVALFAALGEIMRLATTLMLCLVLAGCVSRNPDSLVSDCDSVGDDERGVRTCTQAISSGLLTPFQEAQVLSDRGYYYVGLKRFDDAIADYDRSIALNPNVAGTFHRRGIAHVWKYQIDESIVDFDRAIALKPDLADAYFSRGLSYFDLGKYDEALENYDQALKIDPKMVEAYNSRGHTHFTRQEWDLAVPEYKRAIDVDPKFATAHQNLATTYVMLGQFKLAAEEYNRALELKPDNVFIRGQRATARAWLGDMDGALQDAQEFLEHADDLKAVRGGLDPAGLKIQAQFLRGMISLRRGNYTVAVESFGDAIRANPGLAPAYYLRAAAHRLAGNDQEADKDHKIAVEFDPEIEVKMKAWFDRMS